VSVQIERKRVASEADASPISLIRKVSAVLSTLLTWKRAGRITAADRAIFLRDCNAEGRTVGRVFSLRL